VITADHETGYLTGPGQASARTPLENRGRGVLPGLQWNSKSHTNLPVPLYARGAGADDFRRRARAEDPVYGPCLDNTDVAAVLFEQLGVPAR